MGNLSTQKNLGYSNFSFGKFVIIVTLPCTLSILISKTQGRMKITSGNII
jgi:hypothetical protein